MKASHAEAPVGEDSAMTFWDHLDALRGVLLRAVVLLVALAVGFFILMPDIFDRFILAPCRPDFPVYRWLSDIASSNFLGLGDDASGVDNSTISLINVNLSSQLMLHLSTSLWLAVIVATPALLFLVWQFVAPALYAREQRPLRTALCAGTAMFYLGTAVSYFVIFPLTLRFLAGYQLSPLIPNVISIDSYMDTLTGLCLMMGLVFELPVVAWILGCLGIVERSFFRTYRRHAIVALVVLAAIITPTGDPFTLLVVFIPLYLLWEASALLTPASKAQMSQATA